jgi:tetratricopeptide (TPR) repeat protein
LNSFFSRRERRGYVQKSDGDSKIHITDSIDSKFSDLKNYHDLGVKGDKDSVNTAYELAKRLHEENPDNALAEAYVGSTTALLGRDAVDPGERMKLAMKGVKVLNSAVNKDYQNIDIRILRGYVCYRLPEMFFHKTSTAIDDFKYLVSRYEDNNSIFTRDFYLQVLYDLGNAYKNIFKQKECDNVWNKLLSIAPDSKYNKLINKTNGINETASTNYNKPAEEMFKANDIVPLKDDKKKIDGPSGKSSL